MDDAQLLKEFVQERDESAFARLIDRHGPMVLGICRRLLRNSADADDAFQATFLLLAIRAARIREPRLIGNWLFGVATRTSLMGRRSTARRIVREKHLMRMLGYRTRSETDEADLRMTRDEQIHRLPDKLRRVIVCHHLQGLTTREIAEKLRWPESTVMARLKQARALLRERMSRKGLSISDATIAATLIAIAVPTMLRAATVKAGSAVVAGKIGTGGIVSAKAKTKANGTAKAMFATKLKLAAATVAISMVTLAGTAALTLRSNSALTQSTRSGLKLPARIEQAIRENESQLYPVNLTWTTTTTMTAASAGLPKEVELNKDVAQPIEGKFIWQNGKVYSSWAHGSKQASETTYDGQYFYLGVSQDGKHRSVSKDDNAERWFG